MKKYLTITLLVVGILFSLNVASAATLTLVPSLTSINAGQTVTVDINMDTQGAAVDGVDIYYLHYNPSILQVVGTTISAGSLLPVTLVNTVDATNGKITFSQISTGGNHYTGSGKLASVTFTGIANGTANINFDFTAGGTNQTIIAGAGQNKLTSVNTVSITVIGGPSPAPTPVQTTTPVPTVTPIYDIPTASVAPTVSTTDPLTPAKSLVRFSDDPRVYQVLSGNKLNFIPTLEVFNSIGLSWSQVKIVSPATRSTYTRAKLVRAQDDSKVYYVTEGGLKRWIVSLDIFNSYNDKWSDVVVVTPAEVNALSDSNLIRGPDLTKVYKLENQNGEIVKRWIPDEASFTANGFNWAQIAPVNQTELDTYQTGSNI